MGENENIVDYRLSNIERTLEEMKNVMTETQQEMKKKLESLDDRLRELETRPQRDKARRDKARRDKARRFESVADLVFKTYALECFLHIKHGEYEERNLSTQELIKNEYGEDCLLYVKKAFGVE